MKLNSLPLFAVPCALMFLLSATGDAQRKQNTPPVPAAARKTGDPLDQLISPREKAILAEINRARTNPVEYLKYLEDFKRLYQGKTIKYPDGSTLVTNEGADALDEAIEFVRSRKPLLPLDLRKGLVLAARDHANDMAKTGQTGHKGSDGSLTEDRLSRYGRWDDSVGEDIVYHSRQPREDVIALLIDDGVKSRGHRKNIFKSDFHVIGLALTPPAKSPTMCVITFAGGFADKRSAGPSVPSAQKF